MSRVHIMSAGWSPLRLPDILRVGSEALVLEKLRSILESWQDTKYGSGQRCRGVAADCIGFVSGALDDIDGRPRAQDPRVPVDSCLHDPERSRAAVRDLLDVYKPWVSVSRDLQPFDVVVAGPAGGGPGHVLLVGPQRNTLWHCSQGQGVHMSGWALGEGYESSHAAYRLGDRERWLR